MLIYGYYLRAPVTAVKEIRFYAFTLAFLIATAAVDIIKAINSQ